MPASVGLRRVKRLLLIASAAFPVLTIVSGGAQGSR